MLVTLSEILEDAEISLDIATTEEIDALFT